MECRHYLIYWKRKVLEMYVIKDAATGEKLASARTITDLARVCNIPVPIICRIMRQNKRILLENIPSVIEKVGKER